MKKNATFESAAQELEQIVSQMEKGDLPLETALAKFEEGMKLYEFCSKKLDEVEKKVTLILQDSEGNLREAPFGTE
ncbi:Exodeoxyribonuclease VII small subunit [Desulfatibacillum alkenivorans DSM 16219]|jgi:exodeoxyribonuclease VII small subunit|uniref:Exodeoxyribonuclease 7 small subunit n=1 Tax=Desulfatibacillum alkenivorans DSM 16219 TaxID=1121393 RepID=A0A1M6VPR0_9BACT|nr:exodeoxyribonuclease VII small subunit [Desulfatibacillum alkenivorans]SHK83483.1 Exodeoxyribonuclease VII small subunit [Desulfatibacillum alkenivorans DSM 16219]